MLSQSRQCFVECEEVVSTLAKHIPTDGPRSQFTRALEEIELVRRRAKFDHYTELSKFHPLAPSRVRCYFHGTDYLTA